MVGHLQNTGWSSNKVQTSLVIWVCLVIFQNPEEEEEEEGDDVELSEVNRTFDLDADARSSDEETETGNNDDVTNPDLPANPPQRSFSGSALDLTMRLASNFKRKMSDQVRNRPSRGEIHTNDWFTNIFPQAEFFIIKVAVNIGEILSWGISALALKKALPKDNLVNICPVLCYLI